ncbi:hypothetical protein KILIM_059_00190 [Kineosphaera limosa NBRC 100340]|uniref:Uncharacterized protein n=1 Tax=Kineosphaera limosa NBRC 100340 TaxID=1184609 RepID=K6WD43_9MICO|nr:hypothetical protein KILIM_059_00190 [Kineosphaera limosa NBRC 100340]
MAALRALAAALDEFGMTLAGLQLRERALRERATAAAGASPPTAAPASSQNGSPCEPDEPANPQSHRLRSEAGRAHSLLRRQLADIAHALRP